MFVPLFIALFAGPPGADSSSAATFPRIQGMTATVRNDEFFLVRHGGAITAARLTADPRVESAAVDYQWYRRPAGAAGFYAAGPAVTGGTGHGEEPGAAGVGDLVLGPLVLSWSRGSRELTHLHFTQVRGPIEIYPAQFDTLRDADRLDPDGFVPVGRERRGSGADEAGSAPAAAPPPKADAPQPADAQPADAPAADSETVGTADAAETGAGLGTERTPGQLLGSTSGLASGTGERFPQLKGMTVGVRHDEFLLIRHAGAVTAVRLSADPALANPLRGFGGVDFRWYRRPAGVASFFLSADELPPGAAGNAAVTAGTGHAVDGPGGALRTDSLRLPWSMGGATSSWIYFSGVDGPVEAYPEQFPHLIGADGLNPSRWTTLKPAPPRPPGDVPFRGGGF